MSNFQQLMSEATRLTRAGDLQAATAAIQAALAGKGQAMPFTTMPEAFSFPQVADIQAREVPREAPSSRPEDTGSTTPGEFIAGSFANASTQRDYKLYIPPDAAGRTLPLVLMLHGCTQNPDDFAAGTAMNEVALAQGFYVLYPAQSRKVNPEGCWNWFKHNHQQRGRGEAALLAEMTQQVMGRYAVDPQRVYVAGLSAGGAMAAVLGAAYPDLYAAVGVHSGLAAGAATDLPSALAAMKGGPGTGAPITHGVPTITFHGDADQVVNSCNADQVVTACTGHGCVVETQRVQDGSVLPCTRRIYSDAATGRILAEHWLVHGASHAWVGGSSRGSYTDSRGPDASAEMVRFFLEHPKQPLQ